MKEYLPTPTEKLFGVSIAKKLVFYRELAVLINAGSLIDKALYLTVPYLSPRLLPFVKDAVNDGLPMWRILSAFPDYFSEYEIALIKAGEMGGRLDEALKELTEWVERNLEVRREISSALWYPVFVAHLAVIIPCIPIAVLKCTSTFFITVAQIIGPIYALLACLFLIYRLGARTGSGRFIIDAALGFIPFVGHSLYAAAYSRYLRSFASLYDSGVSVAAAADTAARCCGNAVLEKHCISYGSRIQNGEAISQVFAADKSMPSLVVNMLQAGEVAGSVPDLLRKAADYLDSQAREGLKKVMTVLPILIMLAVGAVVGYVVIQMYSAYITNVMNITGI